MGKEAKTHRGFSMNRLWSLVFTVLIFALTVSTAFAEDDYVIGGSQKSVELTTYDGSEIELYGLNSDYVNDLSVPAKKASSIVFTENGKAVTSGVGSTYNTAVSDSGVVTANYTKWYWKGGMGTTAYMEDCDRIERSVREGSASITVKTSSKSYTVKVKVIDYADAYVDDVVDEFISSNITASMSETEKGKAVLDFVADNYDYNGSYYTMMGMLIHGGGDCWASSSTINYILEKLGIECWLRNANMDPGSGSGHRNSVAILDGDYYMLDAGYGGTAPRMRSFTKLDSLFSFSSTTINGVSGYQVYQYNGKEAPEVFEIPASYNGKPVLGLQANFRVPGSEKVKELVLPEGLVSIGRNAINSWTVLEKINFPATLTTLGELNFTNCNSIKTVNIASGNKSFKYANGVFYNYDKTKLIKAPSVQSVTIPSTVKEIGAYAFYYNKNIEKITLPSSVTTLGVQAFADCDKLKSIKLSDNITALPEAVLASCEELTSLSIPAGVTSVDEMAFAQSGKLEKIIFYGDKPSFGENSFYSVSADAYYPAGWGETPSADTVKGSVNWIPYGDIKINTQPVNRKVKEYSETSFSLKADGTELKYQWQVSADGGESWKNSGLSGNKTEKLTLSALPSRNAYLFRCVITDVVGRKLTSSTVRLTVTEGMTVKSGPKSAYVVGGKNAVFSVEAYGNELRYQWQVSTDGGKNWKNSGLSGNKTEKLTLAATAARNNYMFRCIIKDSHNNTYTSAGATLTVFAIAKQPQSITAVKDSFVKFNVSAVGPELTYQWQVSTDGGASWKNSGLSGNKTKTLKLTATSARQYYRFRCVIKDDNDNTIISSAAKLTVK